MSGQPMRKPEDILDFRAEYLKNLQTEVDVNSMNLQANVVYKSTGQLPPQSSMPDTRTTTEKLADKVRLKVELMSELKPIGGADFAMQAIQAVENSPLNANGDLFIYFAQNSKEYVALLKKKYKYGIKGDANDALQLAKFVEKGYNDTKALSGSVKSSFNRPYSTLDKINAGDIQKTIEILTLLSSKAVAKYGNNIPIATILAETVGLNQSIKLNMPTKVQIDAIRDIIQESGQEILNFEPQPDQPHHNDEEFVQVYNRYLELIDDMPFIPTLYSLFEQLEKNMINASPQVPTQMAINIRDMYGPLITIPNLTDFGRRFRELIAGIEYRGDIIPPVIQPYVNAAGVAAAAAAGYVAGNVAHAGYNAAGYAAGAAGRAGRNAAGYAAGHAAQAGLVAAGFAAGQMQAGLGVLWRTPYDITSPNAIISLGGLAGEAYRYNGGPNVSTILRGIGTAALSMGNDTIFKEFDYSGGNQSLTNSSGLSGISTQFYDAINRGGYIGSLDFDPQFNQIPGPYAVGPSITPPEFTHWGSNGPVGPKYNQSYPTPTLQTSANPTGANSTGAEVIPVDEGYDYGVERNKVQPNVDALIKRINTYEQELHNTRSPAAKAMLQGEIREMKDEYIMTTGRDYETDTNQKATNTSTTKK